MNPYELERLAKQHTGDLRNAAAARHQAARHRAAATRHDRDRSIRHRTGWALVQIGLSLISSSANGPGKGTAMLPSLSGARTGR
jgi:hypothetical protein